MVARPEVPESDRSPTSPVLALRAEGGPGIGAGHQARCLALAQAWIARKGRAILVADVVPEPWRTRYLAAGTEIMAPDEDRDRVVREADAWVVDGYDLCVDDDVLAGNAAIARIDDHALSPDDPVDILLDQNLRASADTYAGRAVGAMGELLLGLRYALLRSELVDLARRSDRSSMGGTTQVAPPTDAGEPHPPHLLVMQGGAPSAEVRAFFAAVVDHVDPAEVRATVLDGAQDPGPLLASADLALAAAGSSAWELCLFGVPAVLVAAAPNQVPVGQGLHGAGAARYAGAIGETDPVTVSAEVLGLAGDRDGRARYGATARRLVDGRGASRLAARLRSLLLAIRAAGPSDAERIWTWNNDPLVRAASGSTADIPWADHEVWFERRLADPATPIYVAEDGRHGDLGVVRFAFGDDGVAEIGIALAPERRGEGWGAAVIDAGCRALARERGSVTVVARVKPDNRASIEAFLDADFDPVDPELDGEPITEDDGMRRFVRLVRPT